MKREASLIRSVKGILDKFEEKEEKIIFLKNYLRNERLDAEISGLLHEFLGELLIETGNEKGEVFEKAASAWEHKWMAHRKGFGRKRALRRAAFDYRVARDIYDQQGNEERVLEVDKKIRIVESAMSSHFGIGKSVFAFGILASLILSFVFFTSNFTGFAISDADQSQSFWLGGFLLVVSAVGAYLVFRKRNLFN